MRTSGRFLASALRIGSLTLASRCLGVLREILFGYYFSTSHLLSAFRIAFMVPNLARRMFGEGALSAAMIPVLTESLHGEGEDSSRRFVGSLLSALVVILGVIVILAEVLIFLLRSFQDDLSLRFAAILMPYMALICVVAVIGGVLQVRRRFAVPAAMPIVLNTVIVLSVVAAASGAGLRGVPLMYVVCVSVLAAGLIQLGLSALALRRARFSPTWGGSWRDSRVRTVARLMGPMILGLSAVQLNTLADYLIAYVFITTDSGERVGPAVLGFAQYLYQLPLGVFGIALATAIFPVLSAKAAAGDRAGMATVFARGVRMSLFLALPATLGMMFVASPLVATLFEHGAFGAEDTHRVSGALTFYAIGLSAYFVQHVLVRTFYALQDSATPARVALRMVAANFAMNLILVHVMEERGLALATSLCALWQAVWLAIKLSGRLTEIEWRPVLASLARAAAGTGFMAIGLALLTWGPAGRTIASFPAAAQLGMLVVVGAGLYALSARVLKMSELAMLLRRSV